MNPQTSSPDTNTPTWRRVAVAALFAVGFAAPAAIPATAQASFEDGFVHFVDRNYRAAQAAVTLDASRGDAEAQWLLGTMYMYGQGVRRNAQSARVWFEKSAAANYRPARTVLKHMRSANTDTQNRQAAEQGIADAAYLLGRKFESGQGVEKDGRKALKLLAIAANSGNVDAQYLAARVLLTDPSVDADPDNAARWLTAAAERDHTRAQLLLGSAMLSGLAGAYNPDAGQAWIRKAAATGLADAEIRLGDFHASGLTGRPDHATAMVWWRKAAAKSDPRAQLRIARAYARGRGVEQDHGQAYVWAALAARQGNEQAELLRNIVAKQLQPAELQVAERALNDKLATSNVASIASSS